MKTVIALLITCIQVVAASHTVTYSFSIPSTELDFTQTIDVPQFHVRNKTLVQVNVQSNWHVDVPAGPYVVDLSLECQGPLGPLVEENRLTEDSTGNWGLGIGIVTDNPGLSSYVGCGTIPFVVNFDLIDSTGPVFGSFDLTVTYTYTH